MKEHATNLPDVNVDDLSAIINQDKDLEVEPEAGLSPDIQDNIDLGGFKNPKDILKSYKEIQAFTTKVAQENKALKDQLQSIQEQIELQRYAAPQQQNVSHAANWDFDRAFVENAGGAVAAVAKGVSEATVAQAIRASKIEEVLVEEQEKNPREFQERFQYAMMLKNNYPQLINTTKGVRKLFEMADKIRLNDTRQKSESYIKNLVGDDIDMDKFRQLLKKDKGDETKNRSNAFMPDTSGGKFRTSSGSSTDKSISESANKGDVDAVIGGIFAKVLAET